MTKHTNDFISDSCVSCVTFGVVLMAQLKLDPVPLILIIALCPFAVCLLDSHLPLPHSPASVSSFGISVV